MKSNTSIKAIIFDFDGVIVESVDIKGKAFRELFKDYPDKLDAIEAFHLENGGMPRYDKFRYIYKNVLKQKLTEGRFIELCEAFAKIVVDKVVEAPFVKGALETLDFYYKNYPLYIVSGTPQDEIKEIIDRRGLGKYFLKVYGSPRSKLELIKEVLTDNRYNPKEVLFIGDSKNDLQAAIDAGIAFIAIQMDKGQPWLQMKGIKRVFPDFLGFIEYFELQCRRPKK